MYVLKYNTVVCSVYLPIAAALSSSVYYVTRVYYFGFPLF